MWSASLLFTLPLSLALTLLFAMRTRRISARTRHKILYTLLCFFVFSEILKHLLALRTGTHTAMYYPFHYSTTYYFSIALYLSENRRMRHFGACTLYVGGSLLFLCMILAPRAIVGDTAQLFADWFRKNGYMMVTVEELARRNGVLMQPNEVYYRFLDGETGKRNDSNT